MSKPNDPNDPTDPTDPTEQTVESVSLPQISIPSKSDSPSPSLTSPPSPSSSLHASSLSYSGDSSCSPPSPSPLSLPSLSLTSLEIESKSKSESALHPTTNQPNKPTPPAAPSTEPPPSSPTPHQPALSLSLTIPLLAFTSHKSPTPLLDCGSITFSPKELVDASYDFLVAKVIISIEKILLSQRDEAQKHVEWMEEGLANGRDEIGIGDGGEGSMGDGIVGSEFDDVGDFHGGIGGDTLPHSPLGNRGSGVGDVGIGSALRREGISNLRCGVLEMFGQSKSKGLRDKKDRKRRWEFQIYEDPVDREPGRPEAATISRPSRERLASEREQIDGGQRAREHVGEDQENEEIGASQQTRQNGEIASDEVVGKDAQSRTPLATLSYLPKNKECNPNTLYIHWTPEPLIPAEYIERTNRMCPTVHVSSSRISQFHPSTPGNRDGRNIVNEVDDIHTEGESKEKEKEEAKKAPIQTLSTTTTPNDPDAIKPSFTTSTSTTPAESEKLNLTILHASFPTHAQFTDAYGNGDGEETSSEGIRELLRFVRERGGRDELIVGYVLL
ncbi:hypothetical protein BOTNAR_0202g00160 [Botryotinia narcissicola]|uniref:Uncharacterized protein n=1 Tax=Botryotinia narcissicola TaxID=278944 RepID=A0A4Z1ICX0_9HELO|nr:hypothetical protein BOTNAR_0202g00160 [Botryotinia narcissicola]